MKKEIFTDKNKIVLMCNPEYTVINGVKETKHYTIIQYTGKQPLQVMTPENESHKDLLGWIIIALLALYIVFNFIYLFSGGKL